MEQHLISLGLYICGRKVVQPLLAPHGTVGYLGSNFGDNFIKQWGKWAIELLLDCIGAIWDAQPSMQQLRTVLWAHSWPSVKQFWAACEQLPCVIAWNQLQHWLQRKRFLHHYVVPVLQYYVNSQEKWLRERAVKGTVGRNWAKNGADFNSKNAVNPSWPPSQIYTWCLNTEDFLMHYDIYVVFLIFETGLESTLQCWMFCSLRVSVISVRFISWERHCASCVPVLCSFAVVLWLLQVEKRNLCAWLHPLIKTLLLSISHHLVPGWKELLGLSTSTPCLCRHRMVGCHSCVVQSPLLF